VHGSIFAKSSPTAPTSTSQNGQASDWPLIYLEFLLRARSPVSYEIRSSEPTAFAKDLLRMKGLAPYFSVVFGGDAFERKKPDPLPLIKTCEALGTEPSRALMVGDSSNDARAARAAGCPVVLVTYGYNHGEPIREVDADGFIDRLDELQFD